MANPKSAGNGPTGPVHARGGAQILDDMAAYIRRHLVCDDHQLTLLTLWSACTHCHHHFRTAPYLHVHSPQPHCGKSLCLNLLADLSDADIVFTGIPAAPLLATLIQDRTLELKSSTEHRRCPVLIDDYQHTFGPSERQPIVCLLASGLDSHSFFARGGMEYAHFSPKALAGNSPLPRSLAMHCIPIVLRPPKPSEKFVRYGSDDSQDERALRDRLLHWLNHVSSTLAQAAKNFPADLPPTLSLGQIKRAEPLLHIADLAGGSWPAQVRAALVAVFDLAESTPELQVLSDICSIFRNHNNPEYLATSDLLSQLRTLDNRPWSAWPANSGRRLAGLLRPFGITSRRLHLSSADDFMGYLLKDFHDAWERYLPSSLTAAEPERINVSSVRKETEAATAAMGSAGGLRAANGAPDTRGF